MNAQRAESYIKVVSVLDSEGGVTLRPDEVIKLRHAADSLFFEEEGRSEAVEEAKAVLSSVVDSERWSEERADRLSDDIEGCGSLVPA